MKKTVHPVIYALVMKLVNMSSSEGEFCRFESDLAHQIASVVKW